LACTGRYDGLKIIIIFKRKIIEIVGCEKYHEVLAGVMCTKQIPINASSIETMMIE